MQPSPHPPIIPRRLGAALFATLLIAFVVGRIVHANAVELGEDQATTHVIVEAELIELLPSAVHSGKVPVVIPRLFTARWSTPDGREHTGELAAPLTSEAGMRLEIWVDRRTGAAVSPPTTPDDAFARASWAAVFTVLGCALAIVAVNILARRLHGRHLGWRRLAQQWRRRYL
ncbi:hypothetical protein ACFWY5_54785 [Nonomuraea sp. NPDC059007]|uniref:hypothetical protein n=1 Tax=Nonomuraea sp. NPDC059007 TaxID=3346692 RepID=UPI0036C43B8B